MTFKPSFIPWCTVPALSHPSGLDKRSKLMAKAGIVHIGTVESGAVGFYGDGKFNLTTRRDTTGRRGQDKGPINIKRICREGAIQILGDLC